MSTQLDAFGDQAQMVNLGTNILLEEGSHFQNRANPVFIPLSTLNNFQT